MRCRDIAPEQATDCVFGYTCVNDATACDLLKPDPSIVHGTRWGMGFPLPRTG